MRNVLEEKGEINTAAEAGAYIVRKASLTDIPPLLALINRYAAEGVMLARTEFEMSENIRDFTVIYDSSGRLAGCGALHFYTPTMGEVRSLAVEPELKKHGLGRLVVEALDREARENQLHAVFAFTYVPGFFEKMGYFEVERGELPLKAWKDCLRCPKFQCCDEIAVLKLLRANPTLFRGAPEEVSLVQFPQVRQPLR